MRHLSCAAGAIAILLLPVAGQAQDRIRHVEPPPLQVSPDLSAPWVMQLRRNPVGGQARDPATRQTPRGYTARPAPAPVVRRPAQAPRAPWARDGNAQEPTRTSALAAGAAREAEPQLDSRFLPQMVDYDGPHSAGTIVIDTNKRFLYHVAGDGKARRYGVGVGKPGFEWAGAHTVSQKRVWPDWRPPKQMIAREKKKGRTLPAHMEGGPSNPLGARALYLGSTLYRIHGTNAPSTIGKAVSSGCIRMRNEDVIELYENVEVGARVVVI